MSAVFALAMFVIGTFAEDLRAFAGMSQGATRAIATAAAYLIPNFAALNVITPVAHGEAVPGSIILWNTLYAFVYAAAAISAAILILERRDLK
jgi:hypothetical protein